MRKATCVIALVVPLLAAGCGSDGGGSKSGKSRQLTVTLAEQNGSGESGTAILTKSGDKTKVVIDLKSPAASSMSEPQPAHIHTGSCDKLDPTPEYALANVEGGKSTTTVDAKLDDLESEAHAINVHKSAADIKTYVACGNIGKGKSSGGGGGGY